MAKAKDVIEKGAKEAATLPMALGVVAVLSSGTVISTYMGLFGGSKVVRTGALAVLTASLLGWAAVGGSRMGAQMKGGARAFSGTLGLMSLVALVQEVTGMNGQTMESQVYANGDGRIFGDITSEDTYSPIGTVSNGAESFAAEEYHQDESPSWNPLDLGQYNPLDSHHQDIGYAPPVWVSDSVPNVSQQPMVATANNVDVGGTVVGGNADVIKSYIRPSTTYNSAGFTGHGVSTAFSAEKAQIGNHVNGSMGQGSIIGQ
tara:strand:- start:222 stop:1001 length:780 start_codon:yes stop_codon:yes gene_type:complete